jgi:hypothetical protein
MAQFPLLPLLPLLAPLCLPFVSPSTYLAPSSCDRNSPPPSQAACKLTPFAPLHPVDPPLPNSQNPASPAPNNDDLRNILALGVQNKNRSTISPSGKILGFQNTTILYFFKNFNSGLENYYFSEAIDKWCQDKLIFIN